MKRFIVIDANAIIHRAYHALPPLTTKNGELINAVYGFLLFFFKAIKELKPDYVISAFDFPAPTFRHQKYNLYKATRPKADKELYLQIPKTKKVLEELGIKVLEKQGFEADDIIGAVSFSAEKENPEIETIILTGDSDTLQLVDENTKVYAIRKGIKDTILYDEKKVKEKYEGLTPKQLPDFKGLRGDPTDNIPGVFGIGEKTAISLIKEFNSIENLYKELENKTEKAGKIKDSLKEKLLAGKEKSFLSKELSIINIETPVEFNLEQCKFLINEEKANEVFEKYEFFSLIPKIKQLSAKEPFKNSQNRQKPEKKQKNSNNLKLI